MAISYKMTRDSVRGAFFAPDSDCLPKYNYSTGAGWRTKNRGHVGIFGGIAVQRIEVRFVGVTDKCPPNHRRTDSGK
jgi:hypothetical protein